MTLDNVAPGALTAASTQAVNGGQINTLGSSEAANLGGGSTFNPATGTVTAPTYNVAGTAYTNVGSAITALTGGSTTAGVKYFHANSTGPDSTATGADSIAVGSGTTATGQYAIAQGFGASAGSGTDMSFRSSGGIAIGAFALAGNNPGGTSLAIGDRASATSATGDAVAIGTNTTANAVDSIAIGAQTTASAVNTIAIGNNGTSNAGTNSVVIGIASTASNAASGSVVLGSNSSASAANETVLGRGASATTTGGVALGNGSMQLRGGLDGGAESFSGTAVASTNGAVSVGAAGAERQITNVAGGTQATDAVNVRQLTAVGTDLAGSLGGGAAFNPATGAYTAPAYTLNGTTYNNVGAALGGVANGAVGPVEYANAATPTTPNGGVPSQNLTLVGAAAGPVTLDNVAPGALTAASTQAVNGAQINTLGSSEATNLGGGSTFNPATGTVTAPTYNVAGGTQANVGAALGALVTATQTQGTGLAMALGGGAAVAPNGTVTAPAYTLNGTTYTNVGTALGGIANGAVGPVEYSNAATPTTPNGGVPSQNLTLVGAAAGPVTLDNVAPGALTAASTQAVNGGQINTLGSSVATNFGGGSTFDPATGTVTAPTYDVAGTAYNNVGSAIGALTGGSTTAGVKYFHANSTGADSSATGVDSVAIGSGAVATNAGDVALGQGSTTAAAVRTAGTTIAGTAYTFAGTNPTSTVSVGAPGAERTITNVAAGQVTATSTDAVNGSELYATNTALGSLASGGAGPVQYANAATPTTPDGGVPSQNLTLVGAAAGPVTLDNVAPGALTTGSTQAVNGGQINTIGTSVATNFGGGSTFDPTTGTVTAPTYNVAGGTQTNVGAALGALDAATQMQGLGLAMALGGGASVAPNGTVTAPAYTLNGTTYTNVGAALGGIANGAVGPVQYANAATPTTPNGGVPSQNLTLVGAAAGPVTLDNVAPGALTATSTQAVNGSQLYATNNNVAALTNGTAGLVQQTGGSPGNGAITIGLATGGATLDVSGTAGNRVVTGVQAGAVNVGSSDAVNGSQLYASSASVAAALGGGSGVAANGTVTAPSYTVQGGTYNNVGGAIGAIDGDLSTLSTAVGGGGIKYFHANSPGGADSQAIGTDSVAIGSGAIANNPGDIALGQGSTTAAAVATTGTTIAGTAYTFAGTTPTSTLSVGALGAERTITNVAAGQLTATSTDAVNGSELYATNQAVTAVGKSTNQLGASTADALGGGATYDPATGKLVAPTYNVGATAYNNVGGAVGALQTGAPLQYSTAAAPTTGNGYVASQDATLVGAASGPVVLHNVGAGVAASDAANVGQLPGAFTAAHSNTFAFAQNGSGGPR